MCAPQTPDYVGAANAQGQANIQAAQVAGHMNNPNITTPQGSQNVTWGQFDQPGFDAAMNQYNASVAQNPNGVFNQSAYQQALDTYRYNLAQGAPDQGPPTPENFTTHQTRPNRDQFTSLSDTANITQTLNPQEQALYESNLANRQGLSGVASQGLGNVQNVLGHAFDPSGLTPYPINPGTTAQNAIMSRLNPQLDRQREALRTQLANQGVAQGGQAYDTAMTGQNERENDLYTQAAVQGINLDTFAAQDAYQRAMMERELPLNEITALMSGSQVQMPQFQGFQGGMNPQAGNISGAAQNQGNYAAGVYNSNMQGLYGLGSSALLYGFLG